MKFSDFISKEMYGVLLETAKNIDVDVDNASVYYDYNTGIISTSKSAGSYLYAMRGKDYTNKCDTGKMAVIIGASFYDSTMYNTFELSIPIGSEMGYDQLKDISIDNFVTNKSCLPLLSAFTTTGNSKPVFNIDGTIIHNPIMLGEFIPKDVFDTLKSDDDDFTLVAENGVFKSKHDTQKWFDDYINNDDFTYEPTTIRVSNFIDESFSGGKGFDICFISKISLLGTAEVDIAIPEQDITDYETFRKQPLTKYIDSKMYTFVEKVIRAGV